MRGAVFDGHLFVGGGSGVLVTDENGDGRAEGFPLEDTGEDLAGVGFVARGDDFTLSRTTAIEFVLNIFFGEERLGGQPSMTTPTPPPWDSPQVEMRKQVPRALDTGGC